MSNEIIVQSSLNPVTFENNYLVNVSNQLIAKKLQNDLMYQVIDAITKKASNELLEKHGEEILKTVLERQSEIIKHIEKYIENNIESFIKELNELQIAFESKNICQCGRLSLTSVIYPELHYKHIFTPMNNLEYLEYRYNKISNWVKNLKHE